jgi:hypothetical protein
MNSPSSFRGKASSTSYKPSPRPRRPSPGTRYPSTTRWTRRKPSRRTAGVGPRVPGNGPRWSARNRVRRTCRRRRDRTRRLQKRDCKGLVSHWLSTESSCKGRGKRHALQMGPPIFFMYSILRSKDLLSLSFCASVPVYTSGALGKPKLRHAKRSKSGHLVSVKTLPCGCEMVERGVPAVIVTSVDGVRKTGMVHESRKVGSEGAMKHIPTLASFALPSLITA